MVCGIMMKKNIEKTQQMNLNDVQKFCWSPGQTPVNLMQVRVRR